MSATAIGALRKKGCGRNVDYPTSLPQPLYRTDAANIAAFFRGSLPCIYSLGATQAARPIPTLPEACLGCGCRRDNTTLYGASNPARLCCDTCERIEKTPLPEAL
jgi:hypothetical protein